MSIEPIPATPAPESPAPARVEVEIMKPLPVYPNPDAMRMEDLFQEVGTGSETSPDAARLRKGVDSVLRWLCPDEGITIRGEAATRILSLLAKPAEQREAEQIPHPVAEAEQSPLPAALDALRKLERACQDLGSTALPVWDYNPPDYLKKEWEVLADMLVEVAPALAQAPTRNAREGA